ncbi:hypothetical protein MTX78_17480 [Hymenobacter tibetensis]|uniref:DUF1735 domain-containing protein n=1 Tax=Hymenobacter tibetensis TaxID=497967 RepID=A0ABY4CUF5_9BACT|nr:hypothetical protein [Hymenobacter tibetensis]UOG73900.1 hypothetical protein MTX78_17480 [Hymenobacter tibetensis]
MKKFIYNILLLLVTVVALASCEKEEENFRVTPQTQIVFDDNIDKITASYRSTGNVVLKIAAPGATSVRVTSTYTGGSVVLGNLPVTDGFVTLSVPATSVRASGTLVGSYSFRVDATLPDGSIETRFFTAAITA